MAAAGEQPLGATIRSAVEATARWTGRNTNLGIVLLLAPLARAAYQGGGSLRDRGARVLAETTVADAADVYAAIRLVRPGGLGTAATEDVAGAPTVTLREAMGLAAERDSVAREYVTGFAVTFEIGAPAVRDARAAGLRWSDAAVEPISACSAAVPDTHIARKLGRAEAETDLARASAAGASAGAVPGRWRPSTPSCATRGTPVIPAPPPT